MSCPTPTKNRYATREAAEQAAGRAQLGVGKYLTPYQCGPSCGWWHLTSHESQPIDRPDSEVTELVAALGDEAFADLVTRDVRGKAHPAEAAALRQPELLTRWEAALAQLQINLEAQFAAKGGDRSPETKDWRRRASYMRLTAAARRKEARALLAEQHRVSVVTTKKSKAERAEAWREAQAVRERNDAECAAAGITREQQKQRRGEAGEAAISRLIAAHRDEFNGYLLEECNRLGCLPPRFMRKNLTLVADPLEGAS